MIMGILRDKKNKSASLTTSPCAQLRDSYHNCFNRWYSEKFLQGECDKDDCCVIEWQKYKECLYQHLDDKHLSRFLEADEIADLTSQVNPRSEKQVPKV